MRKRIILLLVLLYCLSGRLPTEIDPGDSKAVLESISADYKIKLLKFRNQIRHYAELAESTSDVSVLQAVHLDTRKSFKELSFLLTFYESERNKYFLNGPPLRYPFVQDKQVITLEPRGLQVLDEFIFKTRPLDHKNKILELITKLEEDFIAILKIQEFQILSHQEIFEAMRMELVRIFSLGLSGFDTPGSLNAIPEAEASLNAMKNTVLLYAQFFNKNELTFIRLLFNNAIKYLNENQDFDSFDRLTFLTEHINPLYTALLELHEGLGEHFFEEEDTHPSPVNYYATNIFDVNFLNPSYFLGSELNTSIGQQRIQLGRRLFHEANLSHNRKMSCASCHQPDKAFTDGIAKSLANDGMSELQRNSPSLINAIFSTRFFYDLRERIIENQIAHVVVHPKEFNTNFQTIIRYLNNNCDYLFAFQSAYQTESNAVAVQNINNALASYVASLVSFDSPFDRYIQGKSTDIGINERRGFNLFMGKAGCGTCHFPPLFNGLIPPEFSHTESEVLGVTTKHDTLYPILDPDKGRYHSGFPIDKVSIQEHAFKTVSVRNLTLTAPYMHNGAYETLEEVIDFYDRGGGQGMGLDVPNQTLSEDPLNLSSQEKLEIIAFLRSLSEAADSFLQND